MIRSSATGSSSAPTTRTLSSRPRRSTGAYTPPLTFPPYATTCSYPFPPPFYRCLNPSHCAYTPPLRAYTPSLRTPPRAYTPPLRLAPFYRSISPIVSSLLRMQHCTQRHDVLFWLVSHGNEALARVLWAECDLPIHMMLLAAMVSRSMAKYVIQGGAECAARVTTYQEWARGAMECAPDEEAAHQVLARGQSGRLGWVTAGPHGLLGVDLKA